MNNLEKIITEYKDLGLTLGFTAKEEKDGNLTFIQLIDNRAPDWEVIFEVYADSCNVIEFNYDCECQEQSNETVATFEEALQMASEWC